MQMRIPAVFMRGGTSKGVFFHSADLPADAAERDRVLLRVLGSPDPYGRQLDGMGGGLSSLSKAVIIGPTSRADADVDYTFAQVAVDRPLVDYRSNCGNLSSAVGPFSIDEGLCQAADGEVLVRIHNTNTARVIHARFPVADGRAEVAGDFSIDGVSGSGARVSLEFLSPGGAVSGRLQPGNAAVETLVDPLEGRAYAVSMVDASNATVFLRATDLGLAGTETPERIEADRELMARLDRLRRAAGVRMGLAETPEAVPLSNPRVAMVAAPAPYVALDGREVAAAAHDVAVRMLSMERVHRAVPLTNGMCVAAATLLPGTLPNELAPASLGLGPQVRIGNPSGVLQVAAHLARHDAAWQVERTVVYRTARRLMEGWVRVPIG